MKPLLVLLFSLFLLRNQTFAQKNQTIPNYTLRGMFTGKKADALFLEYKDSTGKRIQRKAYIKDGKFMFRGWISSPVYAFLVSDIKVIPNNKYDVSNALEIYLSPGDMTISLHENDFAHAKLTGSQMQDDYDELERQEAPIQQQKSLLYSESWKISAGGNTPKNHAAVLVVGAKIDSCENQLKQMEYQYISTHPASYISAYFLENYLNGEELSLDTAEAFYNSFTPAVKKSISGIAAQKMITSRKASAVGSPVKLPVGTDVNGNVVDLRPLMRKGYIIFDFWASWCISCNLENIHLKQLYNKYHAQGLDVIAISNDDYKKFWRDTIKKQGIDMWHNIMVENVANLDNFYNMQMMAPSLFLLIDKQGVIIGRYRGASTIYKRDYDEGTISDMDKKLASLFPN